MAVAYLGIAWFMIQVVDALHSLLDLPPALVHGALTLIVLGLPILVTTSWVQTRSRTGTAPTDRRRIVRLFTWRNAVLGGMGVFAAWGLVAAIWVMTAGLPGETSATTSNDGAPPASESEPRVLAVLPFDNLLPGGRDQDWLVAGLHEQVIHELSRIPGLRIISRTSVLSYADSDLPAPEIARRLGSTAILEGSVRGDEETLRATLQLIDAATGQHEWSAVFDADREDLLGLQENVARRVAETFRRSAGIDAPEGSAIPANVDPEAVRRYLQGRYLWQNLGTPPGDRAMSLFREAVDVDPDFALAWASLAEAWLASAHFGVPPRTAFPRADSAAVQALAADPDLAEAHVALADTRFHYDRNWAAAERGFRRGLDLSPSHATAHWWYAGLLAARGRADAAAREIRIAREVDPASPIVHAFGARVLYWGGRLAEAEEWVARARAIAPEHPYVNGVWGFVLLEQGRTEDAVNAFEESTAVAPKFLPGLALALARAGREADARAVTERLERAATEGYVAPYERSVAHLAVGDRDRALDLLEEALETRDAELVWLAVEPTFAELRGSSRFEEVLAAAGLADVG